MSKKQQLIEDIDLLLENSELADSADFLVMGAEATYRGTKVNIQVIEDIKLNHKQAVLISKLYYQQNKEVQKIVREHLLSELITSENFARTVTNTFVQIGEADVLFDTLINKFIDCSQGGYLHSLDQINQILFCMSGSFNKSQIKKIREWCIAIIEEENDLGKSRGFIRPDLHITADAILKQTNHILVNDVIQRIEIGFNPEINEDEEKLKEEITRFGFQKDLSDVLDKIDNKFGQARDAFDFKGCMDLLRAFTERLYDTILKEYGEEGKKVDASDSKAVAKFFKDKKLVSSHFGDMIAAQRHFLSDKASHRLKSREEDARLSKNMVIEMSLYLMRRFENH